MVHNTTNGVCLIESSDYSPTQLLIRNDNFFNNVLPQSLELFLNEPTIFEQFKKSKIDELLEESKNIYEESLVATIEIQRQLYKFDRKKIMAECIKKITGDEVLKFYEKYFNRKSKFCKRSLIFFFLNF
jgi:secreted Zn-dependent insulinase-like peptidase